jgi:hypothetical protein
MMATGEQYMTSRSEKERLQWRSICWGGAGCLMMTVSIIGLALL